MKRPEQKFIAGANCPNCGEMDSLLLDTNTQAIECIDCGFNQTPEERDSNNNQQKNDVQLIQIKTLD